MRVTGIQYCDIILAVPDSYFPRPDIKMERHARKYFGIKSFEYVGRNVVFGF